MKIREANKKDLPQLKKLCLEAHREFAKFSKDIIINKQTEKDVSREINLLFLRKFGFRKESTTVFWLIKSI